MVKYVRQFGVISEASALTEGLETFEWPTPAPPTIEPEPIVVGKAPERLTRQTKNSRRAVTVPMVTTKEKTIALCLAGHVRNWSHYSQSLVNFISRHRNAGIEVHVYFACWGDFLGLKNLSEEHPAHHMVGIDQSQPFTTEILSDMIKKLKPQGLSVQYQTPGQFVQKGSALIPYCDHYAHRPIANVSQLFIRDKALALLDDIEIKYDLYVLARFDLVYGTDFVLEPTTVQSGQVHSISNNCHDGMSDLFLFSKTLTPLQQYAKMDLLKITKKNGSRYNAHQMLQFAFEVVFGHQVVDHEFPIGIEGR